MGRDDKGLATSATRKGAIRFRRRWLAPAVGLADPRWSVTETEARALGLVDLDSISLPERALPVDGRFPGEAGWPFVEELLLSLETPGGARGRALEAWLAEAAEDIAASANDGPPLILGAVGDIVVGPEEASFLFASEAGRTRLLDGAAGELDRAGILLGNLESPVAAAGEANPRKRYHFLMPPGSIASLKAMGFDLLCFANNHVLDYGEGAFLATLDEAKSAGLPLAGAGRNATEALAPFCPALPEQDRGAGASIAVIGFASYPNERMGFTTEEGAAGPDKPGTNSDEAATCEAIRKAREAGKLVLVFAHGGSEYRFEPAPEVKARYRSFIDAGAEAVIASHPHVLQGVEAWQGGLIAYSLGNFLFTGGDEPLFAQDAGILYLFIHGGAIRGLGFTPVFAGFLGTRLSPGGGSVLTAFASRTAALAPGK